MHLSPDVLPRPAQHYRLPDLLHNIRLFDLLELPLRSGGKSLQTPDNWIARIQASHPALVVPDRKAQTWACQQRWPLGHGPLASGSHSPVWLALPADCKSARCCARPGGQWAG